MNPRAVDIPGQKVFAPVSVIIPCFCCAGTIERAVTSVIRQTQPPMELLLVDDASSDDGYTLNKLYELRKAVDGINVKVMSLQMNGGPSVARNAGWDAASQPYIAFLDADDSWHPQKLEIQYRWMQAHPHAALTGHGLVWVKCTPPNQELPNHWRATVIGRLRLLVSNCFPTPSVMLRREIPNRFQPSKRRSEDYLLWLQLVLAGRLAQYLDLPLTYSYKADFGQSGLSSDLWEMERGELDTYLQLYKKGLISAATIAWIVPFSLIKYLARILVTAGGKKISWR